MRRSTVIAIFLVLGVTDLFLTWQVVVLPCPLACCSAGREQDREWVENQLYAAQLERLTAELKAGEWTLPEAAAVLAEYLRQRDYDALDVLRSRFEGLSDEACLAIVLLRHTTLWNLGQPPADEASQLRWIGEFERQYGVPLPANAWGEDSGRRR